MQVAGSLSNLSNFEGGERRLPKVGLDYVSTKLVPTDLEQPCLDRRESDVCELAEERYELRRVARNVHHDTESEFGPVLVWSKR